MTTPEPLYRFRMRATQADNSGYYHQRWDQAQSITSMAATKGEAIRKVTDMLGEPSKGRGWSWRFLIDEIEEVRPETTLDPADDLRNTEAGRELMAEAWRKCQEHYAAQWEEAYHVDLFPSPAPPPAVVSRESVAAFMMRHWAVILRADPNPYREETPND